MGVLGQGSTSLCKGGGIVSGLKWGSTSLCKGGPLREGVYKMGI